VPFGEHTELVPVAGGGFLSLAIGEPVTFDGAPRVAEHASPLVELEAGHPDAALAAYRALPADALPEPQLNGFAYELLGENRARDAVAVFELVVAAFPDSMNAHESLAEGYEANHESDKAIAAYKEALATEAVDAQAPADFKQRLHAACVAALKRLGG
jgi:tetratricopeptide (TPR) repeat protein